MILRFFEKIFPSQKQNGFTLIELLVAASILVTALGAPLYVGVRGVIIATEAKDKILGTFLAEEGIELVRNKRDSNILDILINGPAATATSWRDGFAERPPSPDLAANEATCAVFGSNEGCIIGRDSSSMVGSAIYIERCDSNPCTKPLKKLSNTNSDIYGYASSGGGQPSMFTRTIRITDITSDEINVESTVVWQSRGQQRTISVSEHMFSYGF